MVAESWRRLSSCSREVAGNTQVTLGIAALVALNHGGAVKYGAWRQSRAGLPRTPLACVPVFLTGNRRVPNQRTSASRRLLDINCVYCWYSWGTDLEYLDGLRRSSSHP